MLQLNYDECTLTFPCIRKHLVMDANYILYLLKKSIVISNMPKSQSPKYALSIEMSTRIQWTINQKTIDIVQFGFTFKGKLKHFNAASSDLQKLRQALKARIMFRDISDFYQPLSMLGRGGSSKVYLVERKGTKLLYASKCVDKRYLQEDGGYNAMFNEIELMQVMNNDKIIHLEELFEGDNTFYLILEYLEGQSLHDMINKRSAMFDQDQIQLIIRQILQAVAYIHSKNIMHRDLKPENIMFKSSHMLDELKLVDFGLATFSDVEFFPFPKCGTPGYVAPEIANLKDLNTKYDKVCDIFSVGCIFYKLLTGKDLFPGTDYHEILKLNKRCVINLDSLAIYRTPKEAINLITQMLITVPAQRISAKQALDHPYFDQKFETKKSKFQQINNKTNPVWQTQNFKPNIQQKIEDDIVEDENIQQLQVPVMGNLKSFGSFISKVNANGPNLQQLKKPMKKFQTQDFDPYLSPITPFRKLAEQQPSFITKNQVGSDKVQKEKEVKFIQSIKEDDQEEHQ